MEAHLVHGIGFLVTLADVSMLRRKFPIRLAFAATVHKVQGKTLLRMTIGVKPKFLLLETALCGTAKKSKNRRVTLAS